VSGQWNVVESDLVARIRLEILDSVAGQGAMNQRGGGVDHARQLLVPQLNSVDIFHLVVTQFLPRQLQPAGIRFADRQFGILNVLEDVLEVWPIIGERRWRRDGSFRRRLHGVHTACGLRVKIAKNQGDLHLVQGVRFKTGQIEFHLGGGNKVLGRCKDLLLPGGSIVAGSIRVAQLHASMEVNIDLGNGEDDANGSGIDCLQGMNFDVGL